MGDNKLLTQVIYYSLFHKKIVDNENEIVKQFPKNVFGIFSTVRRYRTLKTFPIDIHGCIGYWDTNFNTLNKQILYDKLLQVAYDSVWKDSRNQYFTPIQTDPESVLEVDFMLNPVYSINKNGFITELNTTFTNKQFGIIIQTKDKRQKATYLPNVFPNISWKNLVVSIKNKANIVSDDVDLFAYKIIQIKTNFSSLLTGEEFRYRSIFNFSRLLIDNMKTKLDFPFVYECENNVLKWNSVDDVRNIATLGDVFKYINLYPNIATKGELKIIKQKILNILQRVEQYSSQSVSFLGYVFQLLNVNKTTFCKKLIQDLPVAEDEFEKPEIVIGLNKSGCNVKQYLFTYTSNDSIFKMNWTIQAIISFDKTPSKKLITILESKIDDILRNNTETNYIAVAFEALCFVYRSHRKSTILNKMFELLFKLEQRKECGLYAFRNKTSRVDITGHVMNGFVELTSSMFPSFP